MNKETIQVVIRVAETIALRIGTNSSDMNDAIADAFDSFAEELRQELKED